MSEEIKPFKIHVSDAELDDLKRRVRATRWPDKETVDDWSQGAPLAYVKDVCRHCSNLLRRQSRPRVVTICFYGCLIFDSSARAERHAGLS
jgi:hypothetical protein